MFIRNVSGKAVKKVPPQDNKCLIPPSTAPAAGTKDRRYPARLFGAGCLLFVCCVGAVNAFIPSFVSWGTCSVLPVQQDFDPVKYQGWWWDIERVPNEYQRAAQCINQNLTWTGHSLEVDLRGLSAEGDKSGTVATMTVDQTKDSLNPANMRVASPGVPVVPYQVVSTDYTQYSCVYSCLQLPGVFAEFFWIFGRSPSMAQNTRDICRDKFEDAGIDISKLENVRQGESCPYFPEVPERLKFNKELFETFSPLTNLISSTIKMISPEYQNDDSDIHTSSTAAMTDSIQRLLKAKNLKQDTKDSNMAGVLIPSFVSTTAIMTLCLVIVPIRLGTLWC